MSAADASPEPSGAAPAGAPGSDTGSGGSPSSQPAPGATPETTSAAPAPGSSGGADPGDYEAKIRAGGEGALQELKNLQGRVTRAEQSLAPLKTVLDRYQPDQVNAMIGDIEKVMADSSLAESIVGYLKTGTVVAPKGAEAQADGGGEDDWEDPETKALRERLSRLERGTTTTTIKGHIDSFMQADFDEGIPFGDVLPDDMKLRIVRGLNNNVEAWGKTEQGLAQLRDLRGEQIHAMLMGQLTPKDVRQLTERVNAILVERRKGAATGDYSQAATTGRDGSTYEGSVGDAIRQFCREHGLDENSL